MKKISLVISGLLVVALFLVGCASEAEQVELVDEEGNLVGEATWFKARTYTLKPLVVKEPNYALCGVMGNLILEEEGKYTLSGYSRVHDSVSGNSRVYDSVTPVVTPVSITATEVRFKVNGETTPNLVAGEIYVLADGVKINSIETYAGGIRSVRFCLNK